VFNSKLNYRNLRLIAATFVSMFLGISASWASITYNVDEAFGQDGGSVIGTLTTDGKMGPLQPSDFIAGHLTLQGTNASYVLTKS